MNATLPYMPSMASHSPITTSPRYTGSTWLHPYERKLWPVIPCEDEDTPAKFKASRRRASDMPAILLGKHVFIWVLDHQLSEWEPNKDYFEGYPPFGGDAVRESDNEEVKLEKTRRKAYVEDAKQLGGVTFWKNYMLSKIEVRKIERKMSMRHERRSAGSGSSYSSTNTRKRRRKQQDIDGYLPTPGPTPKKERQRSKDVVISIESDDEMKNENLKSIKASPGYLEDDKDPFFSSAVAKDEEKLETKERAVKKAGEKSKRDVMWNPSAYDDGGCIIFVEDTATKFEVPLRAVKKCEYLNTRLTFTRELRDYIDLHEDTDIEAKEFMPICEYLRNNEFAPRIIESGQLQRLENVVMQEEKDKTAIDLAKVYLSASKIQYGKLQSLCVDKIRLLYPLSANTILTIIMIVTRTAPRECEAEDDIRAWLIDYVAHHF